MKNNKNRIMEEMQLIHQKINNLIGIDIEVMFLTRMILKTKNIILIKLLLLKVLLLLILKKLITWMIS